MIMDGRETRRTFANSVLRQMYDYEYDIPPSTIEAIKRWVEDNNSATASALLDELRAWRKWRTDEDAEDDAAEDSRIKWLVGMIERASVRSQ